MEGLPISETITALVAGLIGWFTSGKFTKSSIEVQNAREVLQMWKDLSVAQKIEIQQLKEEMHSMVKRIEELENHVLRLETENKELKKQLSS
jgi:polyhydroxyalkanoate synthesis regulator phasin